jgi:hypothetical protein
MKRIIIILTLCAGIGLNASAQTFTQRLQKSTKGEATVTVHHSEAIDNLVNGPHVTAQPTTAKSATTVSVTTAKKPQEQKKNVTAETPVTTHQQDTAKQPVDTLSTSHQNARTYKTTGYRVQVFAGGNSRKDRQQAEKIGNQLRTLFPHEAVYVHFFSPRWICRMGNYRNYEEAHHSLQEVKKLGFNAATIVKGKITVQY